MSKTVAWALGSSMLGFGQQHACSEHFWLFSRHQSCIECKDKLWRKGENYYFWFLLFLILHGPSSLTLRPEWVQVCSLFLQISSNSASSSSVPSTPTESRMVKSMLALMKSVANNLPGPTRSWCMSMQWLASLQVLWPVLMCDLWFAHLDLGSLVLPTYNRPQGQEQE